MSLWSKSPAQLVTSMCLAIYGRDAARVTKLLQSGANPNGVDAGTPHIVLAASVGNNADVVRVLAAAGADANAREQFGGRTALMKAAEQEDINTLRVLIEAGAELNAKDDSGKTALCIAANRSSGTAALRYLVGAGADAASAEWCLEYDHHYDEKRAILEGAKSSQTLQNVTRWQHSGLPRKWVNDHNHNWNHQDWESLIEGLKRSEYWPMELHAIGQILEALKGERGTDERAAACYLHPPKRSVAVCSSCGRKLCAACIRQKPLPKSPGRHIMAFFCVDCLPNGQVPAESTLRALGS